MTTADKPVVHGASGHTWRLVGERPRGCDAGYRDLPALLNSPGPVREPFVTIGS